MTTLRRAVKAARFVEPKVGKNKPQRRYGRKAPPEPELVDKLGKAKEEYRAGRRNCFRLGEKKPVNDSVPSIIRFRNPTFQSTTEYGVQYTQEHPELIRQISNRGEVHYVTEE